MNAPRLAGLAFALALHAGAVYAMLDRSASSTLAFAQGDGADDFTVVATVSLESRDIFTQDAKQAAAQAAPVAAEAPPEPVKAEDTPAVTGAAPEQAQEPPREDARPEPAPKIERQAASVATQAQDEQTAAAALAAKRSKLWSAYQIEIHTALEKHKIKPRLGRDGDVLVSITIAPSGQLIARSILKSSGNPDLDGTAIASLERAAPFPPMPPEIATGPLTVSVPFQFRTH
jgi:protein TonB